MQNRTALLKTLARAAFLGVVLATASAVLVPDLAQAQYGGGRDKKKNKSRSTKTLSPAIYKLVEELMIMTEADQNTQALAVLNGIRKVNELGNYDQSVINQFYAQIYVDQEKYVLAARHLEKSLALGREFQQEEQINQTTFNIGQLYIAAGEYRRGINTLENWFRANPNPAPQAMAVMAQAYLGIEPADYRKALGWMERAVAKAIELAEEPKENWYSILVALYFETEQVRKALPILELLVDKHPKRSYWLQLSYVYGEMNREGDQFAAMEAAYHQDILIKSNEIEYLAQLYAGAGIPMRAAALMEKGIKSGTVERKKENLRLLANVLFTARELNRAIIYYEEAGKAGKEPEIYFMLGQIYMQQEDWKKAIRAFENTLSTNADVPKSKKLRTIGTAHYNLGIAYYSDGRRSKAKRSFTKARGYKDVKSGASEWIRRINYEISGAGAQ